MTPKQLLGAAAGLGLGALIGGGAAAETVTVGYQLIYNPWLVPIADDAFSAQTGWEVEYRQFGGGGDVIRAMASGDVQIGEAGSSPITAAAARARTSSCSGSSTTSPTPRRWSRATAPASTASRT